MSAPTTHDPLVVNTKDGMSWVRRAVTQDGRGLYALAGVCDCPEYLMASLAELAEHGIRGQADVLPVRVGADAVSLLGPVCSQEAARAAGLDVAPTATELAVCAESVVHAWGDRWAEPDDEVAGIADAGAQLARALPLLLAEMERMRARVSELLAERHSTNEALSDVTVALREREAAPLTVFRASNDWIVMGLYTTAAEARKHCETELRREWPDGSLDWIEDEEDGVAELVAKTAGGETVTGYVVTPLEVASRFDEEADE